MRALEDVAQGRMPGRLRRLWCEATGGHRIWISDAKINGHVFAVRVFCRRCGALTGWKNVPTGGEHGG